MANEAYINNGTKKKFGSDGSQDVAFTVAGLANAAGRVSAQLDLNAVPRPYRFKWNATCQFQATPTQGGVLELYAVCAPDHDNTLVDGDCGTADAAMGDVDMRRNMKYIGCLVSENAAANEPCNASGEFTTPFRYLSIAAYNAAGSAVHATAANFKFELQPVFDQGQ